MTTASTLAPGSGSGSGDAHPGPGSIPSRLLATAVLPPRTRWQKKAGAATGVFFMAFAAALTASPAYASSPSWLAYVNTQTGRSCSVQSTSATAATGKTAKETMTLLSKSATASGTLLHYRIVTSVGAAGSVKTVSTNSTWEIFRNGSVGLPPGFSGSSGGYTVTFVGSEIYPSPGQLQAGQTATRVLTLTLAGSTGQAAAALSELAANGKTLNLQLTVKASSAATVGSIVTPGGTYSNPVGVVTSVQSMKPLNGSALLDKSWALLSSTFSQFLTSTIYFAPGIGPVKLADPGAGLTLESAGCSG